MSKSLRNLTWFLRHIQSITVRNLSFDTNTRDELPCPRLEILIGKDTQESVLVWKSKPAYDTCNPTWIIEETSQAIQLYSTASDIVIQIYDENSKSDFFECRLHMDELFELGSIDFSKMSKLPTNSIFFGGDATYFISDTLYNSLLVSGLLPGINRVKNTDNSNDYLDEENGKAVTIVELSNLEQQFTSLSIMQENSPRSQTEGYLLLRRLEELEKEVLEAERILNEEKAAEIADIVALRNISDLRKELETYQELRHDISEINVTIRKKWEELQKAEFLLEAKQLKMLYELQNIYPIILNDSTDTYSIRGLELPFDLNQQRDDDLVSSALGYVVHLVLLASKYLDIPLRYQLFFYASRSMIRDTVSGVNQTFPLFRKNSERERFDRAIVWLKKDIEQLLATRGIIYEPPRDILYNLNKLFICEVL